MFRGVRPTASQGPAVTTDDSASFLLPGLVHQFGNILLTVQGNLMHLDGADLERVQADVLSAAKRGVYCYCGLASQEDGHWQMVGRHLCARQPSCNRLSMEAFRHAKHSDGGTHPHMVYKFERDRDSLS